MPAEENLNWMLAKAHFCMGAKAGSQAGLQTYDMFASMWLTKISYVCKLCNIIPFSFVGAMAMRVVGNRTRPDGQPQGDKRG